MYADGILSKVEGSSTFVLAVELCLVVYATRWNARTSCWQIQRDWAVSGPLTIPDAYPYAHGRQCFAFLVENNTFSGSDTHTVLV